jgi:hypothetical protein
MYKNNINNNISDTGDRWGSYMHTVRGKVAEQQDTKINSSGNIWRMY